MVLTEILMKGVFMKHILSFDIAKGKSVYCFINEKKNTIIDATLIEHNKNDFDTLFNVIKDYPNLIVVTTIIQISAHTDKNNPIYLFFRKKQSEGKHHYKCIIACETKLCKIIYKLCSSDCLYENK